MGPQNEASPLARLSKSQTLAWLFGSFVAVFVVLTLIFAKRTM